MINVQEDPRKNKLIESGLRTSYNIPAYKYLIRVAQVIVKHTKSCSITCTHVYVPCASA